MPAATEASQTGKVEQWDEALAIIESDATPYTSMLPKLKKPGGVEVSWQVTAYPQAGHRGVLDNKPATEFNANSRTTLKAVSQKVWWLPAISDFADETEIHGPTQEAAQQIKMAMVTTKRIIEKRLLSNVDCKRQGNTGPTQVPNETRGAFQFFNTTQDNATFAIDPSFVTPAASIYEGPLNGFTERVFLAKCRNAYKLRHGPHHLDFFGGIDLKAAFTDFANYVEQVAGKNSTRFFNQEMNSKALVNTVDRLVLDSGTVDLHASSFMWTDPDTGADTEYTHRSGFACDMELGGIAFTRSPSLQELSKDGSGRRWICDAIFYHMQKNPLGAIAVRSNADS